MRVSGATHKVSEQLPQVSRAAPDMHLHDQIRRPFSGIAVAHAAKTREIDCPRLQTLLRCSSRADIGVAQHVAESGPLEPRGEVRQGTLTVVLPVLVLEAVQRKHHSRIPTNCFKIAKPAF